MGLLTEIMQQVAHPQSCRSVEHLYSNLALLLFSENHEKECKNLNNQIRDLDRQREAAMREVAELKVQLKLVEETRDNIRRDLIEANRKIREGGLSPLNRM